jgi:putative solute:sodium symporter small subunit
MSSHWRSNTRLIAVLLLLWCVVTFGVPFFAVDLHFRLWGWPFSFWMAAQGSLLIYLAIVGFYGWYMNRLDCDENPAEQQ